MPTPRTVRSLAGAAAGATDDGAGAATEAPAVAASVRSTRGPRSRIFPIATSTALSTSTKAMPMPGGLPPALPAGRFQRTRPMADQVAS